MKKRSLVICLSVVFCHIVLTSYRFGTANKNNGVGDATGSPGSSYTCQSCHFGVGGVITSSIEFRPKEWGTSGSTMNYYEAGKTYTVVIKGNHPDVSLDNFGFQFIALQNSDNKAVGVYSNYDVNYLHVYPKTTTAILIEHAQEIPRSSSGNYVAKFDWTAPSTGVGPITLYAVMAAVNGDNHHMKDNSGSPMSLTLNDYTAIDDLAKQTIFNVYPNPVNNKLTINLGKTAAGSFNIYGLSATGAILFNHKVDVSASNSVHEINTSSWLPGLYFIRIQKDGNTKVLPVVK